MLNLPPLTAYYKVLDRRPVLSGVEDRSGLTGRRKAVQTSAPCAAYNPARPVDKPPITAGFDIGPCLCLVTVGKVVKG